MSAKRCIAKDLIEADDIDMRLLPLYTLLSVSSIISENQYGIY